MSRLKDLIHEIHRRSLWQVLLIYVGGALVAYQAVQALTEGLGLPSWFPGLAVVLFIVGLPVVVATSFVREVVVTPPETDVVPETEPTEPRRAALGKRPRATWRVAGLIFLIVLALWGIVATGWMVFREDPAAVVTAERKSVAVLPFDNIGGDEEGEILTGGVHNDVLTHLTNIPDLKVTSRTSVMEYRDTHRNIRDIAERLGVATVLEGGVQRIGGRVRINVQLIDAQTDEHLWAEIYDREFTLEDIFEIQSDIAQRIVAALQATLLPGALEQIERRPTDNLEAWEYFLRGEALFGSGEAMFGRGEYERAVEMYERAVELDPEFADAWAQMAWARSHAYWERFRFEERAQIQADFERALALAPEAVTVLMVRARFVYFGAFGPADPEAAREYSLAAVRLRPNDARVLGIHGDLMRYMGRWDESVAYQRQAVELDPLNGGRVASLASALILMRQFEEASRLMERAMPTLPRSLGDWGVYNRAKLFNLYVFGLQDTDRFRALAEEAELSILLARLAYLRRDYRAALEYLGAAVAGGETASGPGVDTWVEYRHLWTALVYHAMGRNELRQTYGDSIRVYAERTLQTLEAPGGEHRTFLIAFHRSLRGIALALMGDEDAAVREATVAVQAYPVSRDAVNGEHLAHGLALVYALLDRREEAIDQLELLLSVPGQVTCGQLRIDPLYDRLRDHPRFQALVESHEQ
jgi:TolB-like protein/Tfp pilus assembly protein PilF